MPMSVSFIPEEELLDLSFEGNLDLSVTSAVCQVVPDLRASLKTCIMDLTRVERVFDSGIALLRMLSKHLHGAGATVVVLTDHPEVRRRVSLIQGDATYPSRGHYRASETIA